MQKLQKKLEELEDSLKRRTYSSSDAVARNITELFHKQVKDHLFETPADLLQQLITIGDKLIAADKLNFVAPNTIKRILHLIR